MQVKPTSAHRTDAFSPGRRARVAYFVSHPIQYQVPLLRRIAAEADIDLETFFFSDLSLRGYADKGFGNVQVKWDIPLLDGYKSSFLPSVREGDSFTFTRPVNYGIHSAITNGNFDAVWLHGYHTLNCLHVMAVARAHDLPVILRSDSALSDRPRSKAKLAAKRVALGSLRAAVRCILSVGTANTEYWRYYLGENFPVFEAPYAVDNDFFQSRCREASASREVLRSELGLEPGRPVFLFASKLQTRKRCIDLVEAYLRLSPAHGVDPHAYLLIIGDGEERAAVEARIQASGCSSIRMLGFKNQGELPRYFDLCDAFILPSSHEPWGLIVNEVMNAGRAVIVSDKVGCKDDLVHHGENGLVFPAKDVDALSSALAAIVEDPGLAARLGQNSLKTIAHFSFEENVAGLRQALAHCIPGFRA
ncbi:glycosyltransferase family 4 protein [Silvibacterium acidisoli]|uniref:glycosyltransferase family 4 protein n=1 Tax=Acidobacteriaceae bacterium ZG23-2 TaxID=2883246 RepID=UPI00406C5FDA